MPSTAKQTVDITSLIKGILNGYPGNSAIFREYLQNSDDAKATKQIFVLDVRSHPTDSLVDPILEDTQGPALIAWNDQVLSDRDWTALKKIHASSKSSDETQTGKNGLGFRASYHLTENPQILSGPSLLILDPHDEFHQHPGGAQIDIVTEGHQYADQLCSFESILKEPFKEFQGTVFRLPFRTQKQAKRSRIKNTPTSVAEVTEILSNFCKELEEAIVFLKHITSIEIRQVSNVGGQVIGTVTIDPRPNDSLDVFTRQITVDICGKKKRSRLWKYCHYKVDRTQATAILSKRLCYDVGDFMTAEKLTADVELALPLDPTSICGRLFTLLPLPIRTGFPVHFNAVFALTPDRQSLKNIEESGSEQSRERRLIEWNRTIFSDFGAKAWARLLSDLAGDIDDVWSAWPPEATDKNSYWVTLVPNIIQETKTLRVFPTINFSARPPLVSLTDRSILLAPQNPPISLDSLAKMGVSIVQPPSHIFSVLTSPRFESFFTRLSPLSSYERLRSSCAKEPVIPVDSTADIEEIINYLVFWGSTPTNPAFERLIDLPWFTFVDGSQTHLRRPSWFTGTFVVPGSEEETLLFDMPRVMLSWPCISNRLRNALSTAKAKETLNVDTLTSTRILPLLKSRFSFHGGKEEVEGSDADTSWLLRFWKWISGWKREEFYQLAHGLGDLYILPTATGTLRRWSNLSILLVADPATDLLNAWRELGISILHTDLSGSGIFQVLQDYKIGILPSDSSYVSFLASNYRCDEPSSMTPESRNALRSSIQPMLSWMLCDTPISLSPTENMRLSSLPIFSVRAGTGGPPALHPISGDRRHVQVDNDFPLPMLPSTQSLVFIDMNDSLTEGLARLVDAPTSIQILNEHELLTLAVEHWPLQPQSLVETLIERILDNLLKFPAAFCEKLKDLPFITVEGQTQRAAPRAVIDPSSQLAELYKGETGKLPGGRFSRGRYLRMMQSQHFFRSKLDPELVAECLAHLASKEDTRKAAAFLHLLNASWDESFADAVIANREVRWMPESNSPSECRDDRESPQQRYLYDHIFTILRPRGWTVSTPGLRKALGWTDAVPFKVLAKQLSFTIKDVKLVDRTERLKYLIGYFANYPTLSSLHFEQLREIVKGASWVPVHNRKQPVSLIQHATLSATSLGHPFYQAQQALESRHRDFLIGMGCTDRPSIDTLAAELEEALSPGSLSLSTAIPILQEIADHHQEAITTRPDILVPTDSEEARPLADTYYPDMMSDHILEVEKFAVHSQVSKGLAKKLGIPLISSLQLGDDDDDELQMSEDLVGRIRGFLRENDIRFALNEFLANADDAGAKQFSMKLVHQGSYRATSATKVVSPDFQKLGKVSHLIIWNDSLFTQEDFKGLRRVGFGGKRHRGDTHGRHGLGALSLYYFTDVPTIISGDHILILDPSSRYLPACHGQKRTSLFRKLSVFMRQFPDQLRSLYDNFGFTPQQVTYNGTLFLLPLSSEIYEQGFPDYRELLGRTYRDLAANAFFFTRLTDIKVEDGARTLWCVSVDRRTDPLPLSDRFEYHLLQFTRENIAEKWMIATSGKSCIPASQSEVARELKFLPNASMPVQLAIRVDRRQTVESEPSHLFSTLRLPKITSLPFHLNARFAISANRQNIIFYHPNRQNTKDPKSSFNAWILCDLVCPLYLAAFGHITRAHPLLVNAGSRDWLVLKSDSDDVSSYVEESMLGHLPGSDLHLFPSADLNWLTFQQSVFSCDEPTDIEDVLTWLKAPTFVPGFRHTPVATLTGAKRVTIAYLTERLRLPESFLQMSAIELLKEPIRDVFTWLKIPTFAPSFQHTPVTTLMGARRVTISYLMEQLRLPESFLRMSAVELLKEPATIAKTLSLRHVIAIAQYVQTAENLVGLPIIVATTGKLYRVPSKSDPPIYVSPNTSHRHDSLFPTSVFIHDDYNSKTLNALAISNLTNIHLLNEKRVVDIIAAELDTFTEKRQCPSQWLRRLWQAYITLPGPPSIEALRRADLKIIESTQGYISAADCTPQKVVQSPGLREKWIGPIMSMLGINVLKSPEHYVVEKYIKETFPDLFINVIQCLKNRGAAIFDSFGELLDEKSHSSIAAWMRTCHATGSGGGRHKFQIENIKDVLCKLPIWEAYYDGRIQLLPAHRITVLPPRINFRTIEPFLNSTNDAVAVHSSAIIDSLSYSRDNRVQPMSIEGLFDALELPNDRLQGTTQIRDYKKLLQEFLSHNCEPLKGKLRVPDENLFLRLPEELFSHQVALFAEALKYTLRSSFIHASFRELTPLLIGMNLRHEINFQNFRACATAVDIQGRLYLAASTSRRPSRPEIMRMADSVFQCYCRTLPGIIGTDYSQWNQLDNISFVRRKSIRRQGVDYATESYCSNLPILLPPSRLLRPYLEPVAWTVRGLFLMEPSEHLLAVNKHLGRPSIDEVVDHLRILSTKIAGRHRGNANLSSDLRATYKWLDRHHEEARKILAPLSDVPLFLNVDDPQMDQWANNWVPANQLVLNLRFDTPKCRAVREFLEPYQRLLLAAGSRDLKLKKQSGVLAASVTDCMSKLRGIFNEMRSQGELTDICLIPKSPLIYNKCDNIIVFNDLGGLPAHRAFLSASIPHFRIQSQWLNQAEIEFDRSPFAAQAILDFAYTGSLNYPAPESGEDEMNLLQEFCELLQKSDEWDMPDLKRLLQKLIIEDHDMIQRLPQGFELMYATATDAGAEALRGALDRFRAVNEDILEQLNDEEGMGETLQENRAVGRGGAAKEGGIVNKLVTNLGAGFSWIWSWSAVRPVEDC